MVQHARTTPAAEPDERFRELTIAAFHAALGSGEATAAELVNWYLGRIEAHNLAGAELQAVVTVNPRARDEAIARDEFLATEGKLCGPLHGVPVLVKDQAEMAGLRTTFGSILFTGYVPEKDATVIAKLKDAGAIILAKTAMCDFAESEMPSHYALGTILVMPSAYDPHPIAVTEAATLGVPAVISDRCGCFGPHDILRPGENGYVYPCGNTAKLAEILTNLLQDEPARQRLAARAVELALTQDCTVAARSIINAVKSLPQRPHLHA